MSPRAAARLETLGFARVYDYVLGKSDWLATGLPVEGKNASLLRAKDAVRGGDVTCSLSERLGDVANRVQSAGRDAAIVVDAAGVVLGRVRGRNLRGEPGLSVGEVMRLGPATIRAHTDLKEAADRMEQAGVKSVLVTDPDGHLIGTLYLEDAQRRLQEE